MQLPKQKENQLEGLIEALNQQDGNEDEGILSIKYVNANSSLIDNVMEYVEQLNHISNTKADQIQARLPYDIIIK